MSATRARLTMKLVSLTVMLVVTILTARSCSGGSGSSPLSPSNLTHNGVASLCANEQATAAASGDASGSAPLTLPSGGAGALAQIAGISNQSLDCTSTTVGTGP